MNSTFVTIKGTHCKACKSLIEDVARDIAGIQSCTVNFETGETSIEHDQNFDVDLFKHEIEALGQYTVKIN